MSGNTNLKIWGRRLALFLGLLLALVTVIVGGALALLQTDPGRKWTAAMVSQTLSTPDFGLQMEGLRGSLPWNIRLDRLTLSDAQGVWLQVENIETDWRFWELTAGRMDFSKVSAQTVLLFRFPAGEEPKDKAPFSLDRLRLPSLKVDELAVERIKASRPLLMETGEFSLKGRFSFSGNTGLIDLDLRRLDGPPDHLTIKAGLNGDPRALEVAAELEESSGGLLGELLRLPQPAAIRASLKGAGPLSGWPGELRAAVEGQGSIQSRLFLAVSPEPQIKIQGELELQEPLWPEPAAAHLGRRADFDLAARLASGNILTLDQAEIITPKVRLQVEGNLDLTQNVLDGSFTLGTPDLSALTEMTGLKIGGALPVQGRFSGTMEQPVLELEINPETVAYQDFSAGPVRLSLVCSPTAPLSEGFQGLEAKGGVSLSGLKLPIQGFQPEPLQIDFQATTEKMEAIRVERLDIAGGPVRVNASGRLVLDGLDIEAATKVEIRDLSELKTLHGLPIRGEAVLEAKLRGALAGPRLIGDIKGRIEKTAGLPKELTMLLGRELSFSAKAGLGNRIIKISEFTARGKSKIEARGQINLDPKRLELSWQATAAGLSALAEPYGIKVDDRARLTGTVSGPFNQMSAKAGLKLNQITAAGQELTDLAADVDLKGLPGDLQGRVSLKAERAGRSIKIGTDLALTEEELNLKGIRLEAPGTDLTGDVAVNLGNMLMDGRMHLTSGDLGALGGFFGLNLAGSGQADLTLSADQGLQAAALNGWGKDLRLNNQVRIKAADFEAGVKDLRKMTQVSARLEVDSLDSGELLVKKAAITAQGGLERMIIQAQADGQALKPFNLKAETTVSRDEDLTRLVLASLEGKFDRYPVALIQSAALEIGPKVQRLENLDLRLASGRLHGRGLISEEKASINLSAENLSLAPVNLFSPVEIAGTMNARINISGPPSAPALEAEIKLAGVKPGLVEMQGFKPIDVAADINITGGNLAAEAEVTGFGPQPGRVDIFLPVTFSLKPFSLAVPAAATLSGRVKASLNLGLVPMLLALEDQILSGEAQANLEVRGTISDPKAEGSIKITGGRYENIRSGTIFKDLSAEMAADRDRLELIKAIATDGAGGLVSTAGSIRLDPANDFPFNFKINLAKAHLFRLDLFNAVSSGTINLQGTTSRAELAGEIVLDPAELTIPKKLPPDLVELEVREINTASADESVRPRPTGRPFRLDLDAAVEFPARLFVRGRGLDSEWQGRLRVTGTSAEPIIRGQVGVIRGEYDFIGKRFRLTQGSLIFDGSWPPSPLINLTGETVAGDITAKVRLTGLAASPGLSLESDPPLPSDEILARVLFNRTLSNISPLQALRLAQAANELSGGGGPSLDVIGQTREQLGLDELEVRLGQTGSPTLEVGKYLSENIYVEAEKGLEAGSGKVSLEIELSPSISVETEVGAQAQGGASINWKYDY